MASASDRSNDEGALQTLKSAAGLSHESLTLDRAFRYAEARLYARTARWADARDAYLRLAQLDPDAPWIDWDLAEVHRALDARQEAALAYLTAADKHLVRGETDWVVKAYQQAAIISPNDPAVQAKLTEPATPQPPAHAPDPAVPTTLQSSASSMTPRASAKSWLRGADTLVCREDSPRSDPNSAEQRSPSSDKRRNR